MFDRINSVADLERVIAAGFRESETLEYKRATRPIRDKALVDVAISVSAFANASGGTIIWGVAPDEADKTRAKGIEPIASENVENILQAIATHIRRPISGIRHKVLEQEGRPAVLVVDVPPSPDAPHQVISEWRYYRRNGVRKEPMSHDLVELYFGRRLGPRIELSYALKEFEDIPFQGLGEHRALTITAQNAGVQVARHLMVQVMMPETKWFRYVTLEPSSVSWRDDEGLRTYTYYQADRVLHPELQVSFTIHFSVSDAWLHQGRVPITVAAYAEGMRAVRETLRLSMDEHDQIVMNVQQTSLQFAPSA